MMELLQYEQHLLSRCIELAASYQSSVKNRYCLAANGDYNDVPGETEAGTAGMQPC